MTLLKYGVITSASVLSGIAIFGGVAYLVLVFGPDLSESHFAFLMKGQ